mgnify:CR=1 FL=1
MNSYIILDGFKYTTSAKNWGDAISRPALARVMSDGSIDVTFGAGAIQEFGGEIVAPAKAEPGWGSYIDLETSLKKMSPISFQDHYGNQMECVAISWNKRSLLRKWDSPSNKFYFDVRLVVV